jgi:putative hemolysin
MAPLLGELGALQTRLARTQTEIRAAQAIRYRVFYDEMGGSPSPANRASKRDQDEFDRHCDHLLVIDSGGSRPQIVGTYRMMLKSQARLAGAFYTEQEYDIDPLFAANPDATFLELGRSCILPQYRTKRTMELLWHGTWTHALENKVDIMFGCASFAGTDPEATADALNWLGQNAVLDSDEDCAAVAPNHVKLMDRFADSHDRLSMRRAMAGMPPLIKGYLRLGARVGSQAVIDHQFSTTDILVVLKVHQINPRYLAHFGISASRFATQG